jgi:hypothetical protein
MKFKKISIRYNGETNRKHEPIMWDISFRGSPKHLEIRFPIKTDFRIDAFGTPTFTIRFFLPDRLVGTPFLI